MQKEYLLGESLELRFDAQVWAWVDRLEVVAEPWWWQMQWVLVQLRYCYPLAHRHEFLPREVVQRGGALEMLRGRLRKQRPK